MNYFPLGWQPATSPEVDFLYSLLAGKPSQHKGRRNYNLLYAGSGQLARSLDLEEVFSYFESHLELLTAYLASDCLFIHAGVVGWQGQAILLPGRSFSGKTTLVKALIEAGATYYSDEFAILDGAGRIHPYPVPLSLRDESGHNSTKHLAAEFGAQIGTEALPVGLVLATEYQAGARWRPRPLTPAQALLALMDNTVAAQRMPEMSMPILKQVVSGARLIKSKRGEATALAGPLLQYVISP